jgi:hypothetical protein
MFFHSSVLFVLLFPSFLCPIFFPIFFVCTSHHPQSLIIIIMAEDKLRLSCNLATMHWDFLVHERNCLLFTCGTFSSPSVHKNEQILRPSYSDTFSGPWFLQVMPTFTGSVYFRQLKVVLTKSVLGRLIGNLCRPI